MRNRNRHRYPSLGYEERAEVSIHPHMTNRQRPPYLKEQEQGQDQQDKRQDKELPRPASQEQGSITPSRSPLPINPLQTPSLPALLPGTGSRSARKGQRIDLFSSRVAGTSSDRQQVANQSGKDPSDVTLFQHFSRQSRPSTDNDAANTRYTGPKTKTGMSTYIHTLHIHGRWEVGVVRSTARKIHNG